jgi:hypothetical protein
MKSYNLNENIFEIIEIFENATIINSYGDKEHFDAIQIDDLGIIIGYTMGASKTKKTIKEEFIPFGFIPKNNIKHIINGIKKIVYKKIN